MALKSKRRIVKIYSKSGAYERGMYTIKPAMGSDKESARCVCGRVPNGVYPQPVDIEVTRLTKSSIEMPDDLYPQVLSPPLYEVLAPHATTQVFGDVYLRKSNTEVTKAQHRTVYDHPGNEIREFGDLGSKYLSCNVCSRMISWPKGAKQWVSARQADGLKWALGELCIYLSEDLYQSISWDEFRDLTIIPVRVIEGPVG